MIKTGEKYNMLTVLAEAERTKSGHRQFNCLCDCGNEKVIRSHNVESGHIKSCGCFHDKFSITHGKTKTAEYRTWAAMKRRCYNKNVKGYEHYGGRGIKVCDKWKNSFPAFLSDMGVKPGLRYSIERKNNDGDYEPDNCKWATKKEQADNRRDTVNIKKHGLVLNQTEWARKLGLSDSTIKVRIQKGMDPKDAITGLMNKHKPFNVFDVATMDIIGTWDVQTICAKDLGITSKHIGSVLHGNRKSTSGYTMKYI